MADCNCGGGAVGVKTCMSCDALVLAGVEYGDLCEDCQEFEGTTGGYLVPSWGKALESAIASTPDWEELPL